jgi:hypothetical protein
MESSPMLMDQSQHCKNSYITKSNPYVRAIPVEIPITFFTDIKKKSILNFIWKHKRPQIANPE